MNRHERRRRAIKRGRNKFVDEYVHQLPEVGPEALSTPGGITHMIYYHDDGCQIYDGRECNCNPDVRFFAEPQRS
jgi:hypothetical protein